MSRAHNKEAIDPVGCFVFLLFFVLTSGTLWLVLWAAFTLDGHENRIRALETQMENKKK